MVNGQFQEIWEPGVSGPSQSYKEKLCVGLTGQNLGMELKRRKSLCPQILPWKREGVHHQGPGSSTGDTRFAVGHSTWWQTDPHGQNMCLVTFGLSEQRHRNLIGSLTIVRNL